MNGPAHWAEAERLIALAEDPFPFNTDLTQAERTTIVLGALAHATLAHAAATLAGNLILLHPEERAAWDRAAGRPGDDPEATW